jgi:hypothetical protein
VVYHCGSERDFTAMHLGTPGYVGAMAYAVVVTVLHQFKTGSDIVVTYQSAYGFKIIGCKPNSLHGYLVNIVTN